jgi:hypothetical protein
MNDIVWSYDRYSDRGTIKEGSEHLLPHWVRSGAVPIRPLRRAPTPHIKRDEGPTMKLARSLGSAAALVSPLGPFLA